MNKNNKVKSYQNDPRYKEAVAGYQKGDWKLSQEKLDQLTQSFPLETELRNFKQEITLRSKFDQDEASDLEEIKDRKVKGLVIRLSILFAVLLAVGYGVYRFAGYVQQKVREGQALVVEQVEEIEISVLCNNMVSYMNAGYWNEANKLYDQISSRDSENPCLENYESSKAEGSLIDNLYNDAVRKMDQNEYKEALPILEQINEQSPDYLDVNVRISTIQETFRLDEVLLAADVAFQNGEFEEAVEGYTNLHTQNTSYRPTEIEDKLFESLLRAGESVLENRAISLEDLKKADNYFRQALAMRPLNEEGLKRRAQVMGALEETLYWNYINKADAALAEKGDSLTIMDTALEYYQAASYIRPNDPDLQVKIKLVSLFSSAQDEFAGSNWDRVITSLEQVVGVDPNYALGTARQTLYEAYLARGDSLIASGQSDMALLDYRKAAVLAEQQADAVTRLFEAQLKIAATLGVIGDYENAVKTYRAGVDLTGFEQRTLGVETALTKKLDEAEYYASRSNYRTAYRIYTEALRRPDDFYEIKIHEIQENEYLTSIAAQYGTSVSLIVAYNEIADPNKIIAGQDLQIPIIP